MQLPVGEDDLGWNLRVLGDQGAHSFPRGCCRGLWEKERLVRASHLLKKGAPVLLLPSQVSLLVISTGHEAPELSEFKLFTRAIY